MFFFLINIFRQKEQKMFSSSTNTLTVDPFKNLAALVSTFSSLNFDKFILALFVSLLFVGCGSEGSYNGNSPAFAIIHTVIFLDEDDIEIHQESAYKGSSITIPTAPEKRGHIFDGWSEVGGARMIAADEIIHIVVGDITFKAQYIRAYRVSFFDENLDLLEMENVTIGDSVDLDIKKSEYGVANWYLSNNTTAIYGTFTPSRSINFYSIPYAMEVSSQSALNDIRTDPWGHYILTRDIELGVGDGFDATLGWIPIGGNSQTTSFRGVLNGNGYKISGLWIDTPSTGWNGLFGYISQATIKNIGVLIDETKGIKGRNYVGAIVGYAFDGSVITNSYSIGDIKGNNHIGGIAGYINRNSRVDNSYFMGGVSGINQVGGIAGYLFTNSLVANSHFLGNVSGSNNNIGGIVGNVFDNSAVSNSHSSGNVNGNSDVGGIAGHVRRNSIIINTYSDVIVNGSGDDVGGIAGNVSGNSAAFNNAAINQEVNGLSNVSRVIGLVDEGSEISNNFALNTMMVNGSVKTNPNPNEVDGADKTYDDFQMQDTYEIELYWTFGDDYLNPWKIYDGYPYLYWEM
jgi:hypothetical protein